MATEIKAKLSDGERQFVGSYDFGDSLEAMVKKFGEEVVRTNARASMVITAQSVVRRGIKAGKNDAEIQDILTAWKPGVQAAAISDPLGALERAFAAATPEKQAELLKAVQARLNAAKK